MGSEMCIRDRNNSDSEGSEEEGEEENNISTPEEEVDEVFLSLSVSHND